MLPLGIICSNYLLCEGFRREKRIKPKLNLGTQKNESTKKNTTRKKKSIQHISLKKPTPTPTIVPNILCKYAIAERTKKKPKTFPFFSPTNQKRMQMGWRAGFGTELPQQPSTPLGALSDG